MSEGSWTRFEVVDAVGRSHCVTFSGAGYESAFRRHARWWMKHATTRDYHKRVAPDYWPCFPCKIVVTLVDV